MELLNIILSPCAEQASLESRTDILDVCTALFLAASSSTSQVYGTPHKSSHGKVLSLLSSQVLNVPSAYSLSNISMTLFNANHQHSTAPKLPAP